MFCGVVPAQNEAAKISKVLVHLSVIPVDHIFLILNGSTDDTLRVVSSLNIANLTVACFKEALGIDVPRAVGAVLAKKAGATGVLFVDGDMSGEIAARLKEIIYGVEKLGLDMSLCNCYPQGLEWKMSNHALTNYRVKLNKALGLFDKIGIAIPSHGPHAVSQKLLETVPLLYLAIPPLCMAAAQQAGLKIGIGSVIPHMHLGSSLRGQFHSILMAETIIGDCLQALGYLHGNPATRSDRGIEYLGYHPYRRLDILEAVLKAEGFETKK